MTERDFEARLRAGFRQMGDEATPSALRASVIAIPDVVPTAARRRLTPGWRFPPVSRFAPVALAATAVVVVILNGISIFVRSPEIGPSPIPGPADSSSAEPTATSKPAAPATWTATGSMMEARVDFTATLLPDGRVLVTGGDRGFDAVPRALASAELYDPATGTWTATASMSTGRYRHTATLLPNGKVLVAGGNVDSSGSLGVRCCLASAELYDPSTGLWTATGSMIDARVAHTATLLLDGTVLVAGGANALGIPPGAELYDPASGRWTATGSMDDANNPARYDHSATLLRDGRVFVIGGAAPQAPAELYDPRTGSWSETDCCTDDPNRAGPYMTATLLPDGKVLVAGGFVWSDAESFSHAVASPAAVLYDPASGRWTATGSMLVTREEFTATLLIDGKVLVAGGHPRGADPLDTAELYDPSTGTWIATATMVEGRHRQMAILVLDGRVLVAGGSGPEVFDPATGQYSVLNLASVEVYTPGSGS
jgi:hypothetical protein